MKWFSKKKQKITIDQLTDGMLYLIEPSKIQKLAIEDELIPKSTIGDSKLTELIIVRTFIMSKLVQMIFENQVGTKILDVFYKKLFSSFEKNNGGDWTSVFAKLLNARHIEYFEKTKLIDLGDESGMFTVSKAITDNVLGNGTLDVRIIHNFTIFYLSHYKCEGDMFEKYKSDFDIIE